MSILVNKHTRLIVQGITGSEGVFHTERMRAYRDGHRRWSNAR